MRKIVYMLGTSVFLVASLVACGAVQEQGSGDTSEPAVEIQKVDGQNREIYIVEKEVEEGQYVTCVVFKHDGGYDGQGGLSCNWEEYNNQYDNTTAE